MSPCCHICNTHTHTHTHTSSQGDHHAVSVMCSCVQTSLLACKIQFSHPLRGGEGRGAQTDQITRYVCLRLNDSCRFITLRRQTKYLFLLLPSSSSSSSVLVKLTENGLKTDLVSKRHLHSRLHRGRVESLCLFQFSGRVDADSLSPLGDDGGDTVTAPRLHTHTHTHTPEALLHLSWLRSWMAGFHRA